MELSREEFNKLSAVEQRRLALISAKAKAKKARAGKPGSKVLRKKGAVGPNKRPVGGVSPMKSVASAYSSRVATRAPVITRDGDTCRVRHRELLSSVTGSTNFTVASTIPINPGLVASFPWLSAMANSWEQYRFNSLNFEYFTRTGSNVPGSVLMAVDYDASDSAPATELIVSTYEGAVQDSPWNDMVCVCRKQSLASTTKMHYTRSAAVANTDIKMYDVGVMYLTTSDGTAVNWGKLWVSYDVTFRIPQLPPGGIGGVLSNGGQITGATTMTGANPFGVGPTVDANASGIAINTASVLSFTVVGEFVCSVNFVGTAITVAGAPTAGAGVTILASVSSINAAATQAVYLTTVRVTSLIAATLSYALTATTITASSLNIGQAPTNSLN